MHACYDAGMKSTTPQYTVRNMPAPVDKYLRRRARQTGKSINQIIIDELSERAGVTKNGKKVTLAESLRWFIGSGFDSEVAKILDEEDRLQKTVVAAREERKMAAVRKQLNRP